MSAVEDAQRAVTEFLLAIPAVRDSGIIAPLQGLLAALPGLIRLASRFNQLTDDLTEANADPDAITLAKGGTQLSMFVRFHEDATGGEIGATLQPARELFEAVHDRTHGARRTLLWDAISKPSRNRAYDITRAHLAAAVDWLDAANMKRAAAEQWWGKPPGEYARAHKWRERITGRTATDLTVFVFDQLKPPRRSQVSEAEAKAKAEELRKIASDRKTKA